MNIISEVEPPPVVLELTGKETQRLMTLLFRHEGTSANPIVISDTGISLYAALYQKGYRKVGDS